MKSRILQKLKEIQENLDLINDHLPSSSQEFKALGLVKDGIYKRLEFSIQNLIDICSMVYSGLQLGVPSDTDDIFNKLLEKKIFPEKTILLIQEMKGLRNILIHRYGKIDDEIIHELLTERMNDFDNVLSIIENSKKIYKQK